MGCAISNQVICSMYRRREGGGGCGRTGKRKGRVLKFLKHCMRLCQNICFKSSEMHTVGEAQTVCVEEFGVVYEHATVCD